MALWMIPAALAAAGALKASTVDKDREKRQRRMAQETLRWSPWTGMQPNQIQEADVLGSAMQGAMGGAGLMQGIQQSQQGDQMLEAMRQQQAAGQNVQAPAYMPGQGMGMYAQSSPWGQPSPWYSTTTNQ